MRDLQRRIEKLEQLVSGGDCNCAIRPVWRRFFDHYGTELPNGKPRPIASRCPVHGDIGPRVIVRQFIKPGSQRGIALGYRAVVM